MYRTKKTIEVLLAIICIIVKAGITILLRISRIVIELSHTIMTIIGIIGDMVYSIISYTAETIIWMITPIRHAIEYVIAMCIRITTWVPYCTARISANKLISTITKTTTFVVCLAMVVVYSFLHVQYSEIVYEPHNVAWESAIETPIKQQYATMKAERETRKATREAKKRSKRRAEKETREAEREEDLQRVRRKLEKERRARYTDRELMEKLVFDNH